MIVVLQFFCNSKKYCGLGYLVGVLRRGAKPWCFAAYIFAAIAREAQVALVVLRVAGLERLPAPCATTRPIIQNHLLQQPLTAGARMPFAFASDER